MSLVERLEKLAKELDQQRWRNGVYDPDKADQSDLLMEAAKIIRQVEWPPVMVAPQWTEAEWDQMLSSQRLGYISCQT